VDSINKYNSDTYKQRARERQNYDFAPSPFWKTLRKSWKAIFSLKQKKKGHV
jgi:hypothetical protein